jgi:hypothetical protein
MLPLEGGPIELIQLHIKAGLLLGPAFYLTCKLVFYIYAHKNSELNFSPKLEVSYLIIETPHILLISFANLLSRSIFIIIVSSAWFRILSLGDN